MTATAHRARLRHERRARIDQLCELVSQDMPIAQAARAIGVSVQTATSMMAQVRAELGWQAQ